MLQAGKGKADLGYGAVPVSIPRSERSSRHYIGCILAGPGVL